MEKIKLPLVSYENYEIIEGDSEFIELFDKYLRSYGIYSVSYTEDSIPSVSNRDFEYIIFKESVSSINRRFAHVYQCWMVELFYGSSSIEFMMKSKTAADALKTKLLEWKLSKTSSE